jgi:Arc/MetJ-type ribon-helix-helix transcriptional regulator
MMNTDYTKPLTKGQWSSSTGGPSKSASSQNAPKVEKYDESKFYTKATNYANHGHAVGFQITPELYARIQMLVESKFFPDYKTAPDVMRDAIAHWTTRRENETGDIHLLKAVKAYREQDEALYVSVQTQRMVEFFRTYLEQNEKTFQGLLEFEDWTGILDHLVELSEFASGQREPYRAKLVEQVKRWGERVPEAERENYDNTSSGKGTLVCS